MNVVHDRGAVYALMLLAVIGCTKPTPPPISPAPFEGLGSHSRDIRSPPAQASFDQGLAFLYAFNHDEAIRGFERAASLDPQHPMPYWGIAIANGPHINNPVMDDKQLAAALAAIAEATRRKARANDRERALIEALEQRHGVPGAGHPAVRGEDYANAMREAWKRYPDDADIGALFAESLLNLRPWDQWTKDGKAQPGTDEILTVLEDVLRKAPNHPLANHLYVHALEASPTPERADQAANRLRTMAPGLGHLLHMPSHIDVRRGRWADAIVANERAIEADAKYRRVVATQGFYNLYSAHNHHMMAFAAMMSGRKADAIRAIRRLVEEMPEKWLAERAVIADGFNALPFEVLLRFGEWDAVLAEPEPAEYLPLSRAMRLYARAVALAAKGDVEKARAEQTLFREQSARVPEETHFGNNTAKDLLAIGDAFLEGEILYRDKKIDAAIAALREAVQREDALRYDEPPDWIQPTRHTLGAILVENKRFAEAEQVYRADLAQHPENGWSLFGLASALRAQGKSADEVEARFRRAWDKADAKITSSCLCVPSASR